MKTAAVAELKANLSKYLNQVKGGEQVLITDRDVPVAKLVPLEDQKEALQGHLQDLQKAGLAVIGSGKIPKKFWQWTRPADSKGKAVKSLIQERAKNR